MDNDPQKTIDIIVDLIKNTNEKINLAKEAMALNLNIAEETQHKLWEKVEEINNKIDCIEKIQENQSESLRLNFDYTVKQIEKINKRLRDIERVMPEWDDISKPPS
tara:strand:+ start:461 stop:778 length:318 start_codon:yes stop_codon:yes gene_type:complete